MNRFLDKIKTGLLTIFIGCAAWLVICGNSIQMIAKFHQVKFRDCAQFMISYSLSTWPISLQVAFIGSILLGICIAVTAFWWLRDMRWTPRNYDLRSEDSTESLIRKGAVVVLDDNARTHQVPSNTSVAPSNTFAIPLNASAVHSKSINKSNVALWAGKYAGNNLFVSHEDRGLVVGPPGVGKTAFLLNQLLRSMKQNLSFVLIDFKPELYEILAETLNDSGYRVLLINPAKQDSMANSWNPLADIDSDDEIALNEMCAALLPIADARDKPFTESQRDWLKLGLLQAKTQPGGSLISGFNWLTSAAPTQLLTAAAQSSNTSVVRLARRLTAGLERDPLVISGYSGCLRNLDWLALTPIQRSLSHSDFSMRDFGKGYQPTALFIRFDETRAETLGPILGFLSTSILKILIDSAGKRATVALYLDELGNMPAIPGLMQRLNTIRSRHLPTWMFFQGTDQINERYGQGAENIFFASSDVQIFFRENDRHTRQLVSDLIGTHEKNKFSTSHSNRNGSSYTKTRERVNTIEPHQLGQLKSSEVVTLYRGAAAIGRATPHYIDFPQFRRQQ